MTVGPPAGWVYVCWHPQSERHTKIGYSKWHPTNPDEKYSYKRVHQVGRHLVSFGFGPLESWSSDFHANAKGIEREVQRELRDFLRTGLGPSSDIFNIDPQDAITVVQKYFSNTTQG